MSDNKECNCEQSLKLLEEKQALEVLIKDLLAGLAIAQEQLAVLARHCKYTVDELKNI